MSLNGRELQKYVDQMRELLFTLGKGGPGSGRHPEGGTATLTQHPERGEFGRVSETSNFKEWKASSGAGVLHGWHPDGTHTIREHDSSGKETDAQHFGTRAEAAQHLANKYGIYKVTDGEDSINLAKYITHSNGKYTVHSESGKPMGTYGSEGEAKHRLQQIEYFKTRKGLIDAIRDLLSKNGGTEEGLPPIISTKIGGSNERPVIYGKQPQSTRFQGNTDGRGVNNIGGGIGPNGGTYKT